MIYDADIGLCVFELATDEKKAQVSPSTNNTSAFGITQVIKEPGYKISDRRLARHCHIQQMEQLQTWL
jgi:hypothetical protein